MKEINLSLSIDEINLILDGLGNMPFKAVYALIGKIQSQAAGQMHENGHVPDQPEKNASPKTVRQTPVN